MLFLLFHPRRCSLLRLLRLLRLDPTAHKFGGAVGLRPEDGAGPVSLAAGVEGGPGLEDRGGEGGATRVGVVAGSQGGRPGSDGGTPLDGIFVEPAREVDEGAWKVVGVRVCGTLSAREHAFEADGGGDDGGARAPGVGDLAFDAGPEAERRQEHAVLSKGGVLVLDGAEDAEAPRRIVEGAVVRARLRAEDVQFVVDSRCEPWPNDGFQDVHGVDVGGVEETSDEDEVASVAKVGRLGDVVVVAVEEAADHELVGVDLEVPRHQIALRVRDDDRHVRPVGRGHFPRGGLPVRESVQSECRVGQERSLLSRGSLSRSPEAMDVLGIEDAEGAGTRLSHAPAEHLLRVIPVEHRDPHHAVVVVVVVVAACMESVLDGLRRRGAVVRVHAHAPRPAQVSLDRRRQLGLQRRRRHARHSPLHASPSLKLPAESPEQHLRPNSRSRPPQVRPVRRKPRHPSSHHAGAKGPCRRSPSTTRPSTWRPTPARRRSVTGRRRAATRVGTRGGRTRRPT
mmetsp:Transcript_9046/g.27750  ORF Transcript_9046/g.27750 Transcript_9046/m.27750 type:complete len:510 (-) Transcript_9046:226-1755(-)